MTYGVAQKSETSFNYSHLKNYHNHFCYLKNQKTGLIYFSVDIKVIHITSHFFKMRVINMSPFSGPPCKCGVEYALGGMRLLVFTAANESQLRCATMPTASSSSL